MLIDTMVNLKNVFLILLSEVIMNQKGSYNVSSMTKREEELARLRTQAEQLYPMESKLLKEWCGLKSHHRVLEVGCGPGFLTPLLCELASEGSVTACDTSSELLTLCQNQNIKKPKLGFQTILSVGDTLPLENKSQDFSYLRFVLQHVPEKMILLKDIERCTADDGKICILDSDDGLSLQYPEDKFVNNLIRDAQKAQTERGGDRFIGRKVGGYLQELGFQEIQTRVLNFTSSDLPFPTLARISLGFKADLCGRKDELESWIQEMLPNAKSGKFFLSAGVILTVAKKGKL